MKLRGLSLLSQLHLGNNYLRRRDDNIVTCNGGTLPVLYIKLFRSEYTVTRIDIGPVSSAALGFTLPDRNLTLSYKNVYGI